MAVSLFMFSTNVDAADDVASEAASSVVTDVTSEQLPRQGANIAADPINSSYLLQLVAGLFVVLLCIVVLAWFAKRFNRLQTSSDGSLQILGGLSMGARERVVLVQIGEEQLLLGVAPGRINMLHCLKQAVNTPSHQHDAHGKQATKSFGHFLADKLQSAVTASSNTARSASASSRAANTEGGRFLKAGA
jgi:flagellar protein FliO/FliZ